MQLPAHELQVGDVIHGHHGAEPLPQPMLVLRVGPSTNGTVVVTYRVDGERRFGRRFPAGDRLDVTRATGYSTTTNPRRETGFGIVEHAGSWYGIILATGQIDTGPWPSANHADAMVRGYVDPAPVRTALEGVARITIPAAGVHRRAAMDYLDAVRSLEVARAALAAVRELEAEGEDHPGTLSAAEQASVEAAASTILRICERMHAGRGVGE